MFPEQCKRTLRTSRFVHDVVREKRPQFRRERRLFVPAYNLMNDPW